MSHIHYQTLENVDMVSLHKVFLDAFSDYLIKMNPSLEGFSAMLLKRGYNRNLSIGAFDEGRLVGFVLNAKETLAGVETAYDITTGVACGYRRKGIARKMMEASKKHLKLNGIEDYMLEVIRSNISAYTLYSELGFEIKRTLVSLILEKYDDSENVNKTYVMSTDSEVYPSSFWDVQPSWQNSIAALKRSCDHVYNCFAYEGDELVGYGVIDKMSGDIAHLAVSKAYRKRGIGSAILRDLAMNTRASSISLTNVDTHADHLIHFLEKKGFKERIQQFEMNIKL